MEKPTEIKSKNTFLKEAFISDISKHHTSYLGITVPEVYFEKSKFSILEKVKLEEKNSKALEKKQLFFSILPKTKYAAVASFVFLFGLAVWLQNRFKKHSFPTINIEMLSFTEDNLINSILVNDAEFEAFADATLLNEIILKTESAERQMDNLFINSLFIKDSLMDTYMSESFIETIML